MPSDRQSSGSRSMGTGGSGTRDVAYDLVSVMYHALQGAETYMMYIQDAEESGDREVAEFFRQVHQEETRRADKAKEFLGKHLSKSGSQGSKARAA